MKSPGETPLSLLSIVRDTSEYERAKEGLLEERHHLHTLMDNLPDPIYFKDRESHFTRINLALANEFKLNHPDQAVGKSDFDFFTEEHAQEAYKHEQEIIRMGQPMVDKEEKQTWTDGHVTWVSNTKMPLRDVNGDIIGTFGVSRDITQRKRAEDARRDSEEKYRSLVSNIPDVVWTVDDQLRFAFIGSNVEKLTGYSQEEVYEKGAQIYLDFLHPDDVHRVREGFRALIAEGQPFDVDCRLKRKDGEWIWVHDRAIATYEKNGIRYADGLISDITARKRAEAEMAERHRLATLMAETGVVLTRAESLHQGLQQCAEILVRNIGAAFARVWTLNDEESVLELQASAGIYTDLDGGHARVPIGKFKIGRIAESGESHLTNSVQEDPWVGDPEWARRECMVAFAGYPLKVDGRVLGVVAAFARHPLTETTLQAFASVADNIAQFIKRKRAEQQSQLQTAALESAANGIVIASREGRIIWVNPAFTRLTGYPACEVMGENPRVLKSGVHDEVFYQRLWKTILSGETWRGEIVNRRKDGTLYTEEMTITPVCGTAGTIHHFIAIKQDITARKRAEESLRQSEELFRATVENAGVGVALVDLQGRPIKSNPALRQMLGYSDEELGRMAFTEFTHPDDRELDWGLFNELAAGKREKYEIQKRFLKKGGGVVWGALTVSLVKSGHGRSVGAVGMVQDITERKRAEEEMYKSRQMLQIILDTIPQRVFWKDRNLSYSGCNQAFATDAGLKDSTEIIGKNDYELAWRETAERYRADDKLVMEYEAPRLNFDEPQNRPDGSLMWLRSSKLPLRDREGKVIGVIGTYEDITTRKQIEVKLQEQQSFVEAVLESVQSGIIACNEQGATTLFNKQTREIFGMPQEDVTPDEWAQYYDLYLADGKTLMKKEEVPLFRALQGEHISNMEMTIIPKHGEPRAVLASAQPIIDSKGRNRGAVGAFHDITIRRRAEQDLLFKTALLEAQSETTIDGILVVDVTDQVLMVNRQFAKIWGFPEDDIPTRDDKKLTQLVQMQIKDPEAFLKRVRYLNTHETEKSRDELELKDGRVFDRYSAPLQSSTRKLYGRIWYFRDITERRELDRMKSELISVVSHELRTPLTSIRGALGLLAGGLLRSHPEKGERMLEIAVSNTDRLVRLINDILDIERIESGKMNLEKKTCNAADLMTQAADSVRDLAERAGVVLSVSPHPARLWVDPDRIIQVFINLLSNAIKFSVRGGTIWLNATPQADQILFQVKDQGRGIPNEKQESIFERFQQVDASDRREKGGTGLGLAITRGIVQEHGGWIWVESTMGQGSTFSFTIPLLPAETILVGNGPGPRKVLVCAFKADICSALQAVLSQGSYTVLVSSSWQQAIEMAATEPPDAILLDSSLLGVESLETITASMPSPPAQGIPVIGLGEKAPDEVELAAMGMAGWVTKPLNQGSVLRALESVLGKPSERARVLVVEDDVDLARVLTTVFERHGAVVFHARTGPEAIHVCPQFIPDLIVLDVILPELDGFGVVEQLRQDERLKHLPLAVYSVKELDDSEKARLRLGESIFMTKSRLTPQEFEQRAIGLLNWATSGQKERRRQ